MQLKKIMDGKKNIKFSIMPAEATNDTTTYLIEDTEYRYYDGEIPVIYQREQSVPDDTKITLFDDSKCYIEAIRHQYNYVPDAEKLIRNMFNQARIEFGTAMENIKVDEYTHAVYTIVDNPDLVSGALVKLLQFMRFFMNNSIKKIVTQEGKEQENLSTDFISGKIINLWKEPILKHNATSFMCDGFAFTDDIGDALQIIWDDNNKHYTDDSYTQDELSFSVGLNEKDVDTFLKTIVKHFGCAYNEKTKEITSANADDLLSLLNYIYQTVNIFLGGSTEEKAPIKMFIRNLENLR